MGKPEECCGTGGWKHGGAGWGMGQMGMGSGHWGKWLLIGLAIMAIMANKRMWQGEGMGMGQPGMMGGRWMGGPWGMGGRWGMGGHGMMGGMAPWRHFVSAEEKIGGLEKYLEQLRLEEKGVEERIDHLRTRTGGGEQ